MRDSNAISQPKSYLTCLIFLAFYLYVIFLQTLPGVFIAYWADLHLPIATKFISISGLLFSFFYSYIPAQLIASIFYDYFNSKYLVTIGILFCAISAALWGMATSYTMALLSQLLLGLGMAFSTTGFLVYISRHFLAIRFTFFVSLLISIQILTMIIVPHYFALAISLTFKTHGPLLFFILSISGLGLAIMALAFIKDNTPVNKTILVEHLKQIFLIGENWIAMVYSFAVWMPIALFNGIWGLPYLQARYGISTASAKVAISAILVSAIIATPLIASLSDFIRRRQPFMALCALIGLSAILIILFKKDIPLLAMYALLACMGIAAAAQSLTFGIINDSNLPRYHGTIFGLNITALLIGKELLNPLINSLFIRHWEGYFQPHFPIYQASIYHHALLIIVPCYAIALFVSTVLLKDNPDYN